MSKREFLQDMSVLLFGLYHLGFNETLGKKKLDRYYTKMLRAVLKKS